MSRCGYSDDYEYGQLWMKAVENAIRGARGQRFLRDLVAALDAMPEKRLVEGELERDGEVCAIGSVGRLRGVDLEGVDPEDHDLLAQRFDIARALVMHTEFVNDEDSQTHDETPELRFQRVRRWAVENIIEWDAVAE